MDVKIEETLALQTSFLVEFKNDLKSKLEEVSMEMKKFKFSVRDT